jgi:ribose transport system permease protein
MTDNLISATETPTEPTEDAAPSRSRGRRLNLSLVRDYSALVTFLGIFIALSVSTPAFFTTTNLLNILDQNASLGLVACGATLVIIASGFDLSSGAIFAVAGVVAAWLALRISIPLALLAGVLIGPALGTVNGSLVTMLRINSFLATLASSLAINGLAVAISGGFLIAVQDPSFATLGRESFLSVRYAVFLFAAFALITWFLLTKTKYGRYVYAIGGNEEAARLSGVRVSLVRSSTFVFSGLSASLAGVVAASRIATGESDVGADLALTAIAAVVLGGTSITGGAGGVWRTILGVLILALISNGFDILNVAPFYRDIFSGGIIVLAVALNRLAETSR